MKPMNKRAKKRLKETIAKDKQERAKSLPQQRPGSAKDPQQLRGFLPKPAKKRGYAHVDSRLLLVDSSLKCNFEIEPAICMSDLISLSRWEREGEEYAAK
jgi:hypothetical protein